MFYDTKCTYFDSVDVIDHKRRTLSALFIDALKVQATFVSQHLLEGYVFSDEVFAHGTLDMADNSCRIETL